MYLRITKRRNRDGTEVRYYQLAENVWNAERGHAIAKVVYNFGRADEIDHDDLRRLASSILRVVGDGSVPGEEVTIRDACKLAAGQPAGSGGINAEHGDPQRRDEHLA